MNWLDRQSFLGARSERRLAEVTVGLVGVGGGNSHVAQQLAHVGIGNFVLVDEDRISLTNLNRLIGGTWWYVLKRTVKVEIMKRMIKAINPKARVEIHREKWQLVGDALKRCDVIVGGLDNVRGKDELDAFCRRFLIPFIDQGMDVHKLEVGHGHLVAGQVVLSQPGSPCLRCMGVVTDEALAEEARKYGAAGGRPQVVWSNGVLASLAVGLVVQMVTPWNRRARAGAYLSYDGNSGVVTEAERFRRMASASCPHYPQAAVGDMSFDVRKLAAGDTKAEHPPSWWMRAISERVRKWMTGS
ncbi:ThiF family adenylyltransferase [Bosea sp. (in: a-proteobacteria)]|uniref:HesA/MoeB/ThiF family protein n=1 Tax=Bosea sp. (in: a-proteobacteria) TaxID=1871050 RepID=UPI002735FBD6|nr:ThiF family adenylyltransferase [Bosea sp. (in: a-proteobacteria)]MDP3411053.1 ThiF family adenylyltransferase [Bosea sp. (in: a-proteobacteria)]